MEHNKNSKQGFGQLEMEVGRENWEFLQIVINRLWELGLTWGREGSGETCCGLPILEHISRRENGCLQGCIVIGQGGMVLNWDRGGLGWILGGSFSPRGWWRTEQVAQGGCGCPIPGGIQGQAGCGSGQPGLLVGDPAHSRGVGTQWALWAFSTQAILGFHDSLH